MDIKKILLFVVLLFSYSTIPGDDIGALKTDGVDIGALQDSLTGSGGGYDSTINLSLLSQDSTCSTYVNICSLYVADTGSIIRLYDSAAGEWTQRDSSGWRGEGGFRDTLSRGSLTADTKYHIMIVATDSIGQNDTIRDSITTLRETPVITYATSICTTDISFSVDTTSTGGDPDSIVNIDALPNGLSITKTGANMGRISGTCDLIVSLPKDTFRIVAYNNGGNDTTNFILTISLNTQIYVDHRHVVMFPHIPDYWISVVKTKMFGYWGESHGRAGGYGPFYIDTSDGTGKYAAKIIWSGAPTAAADSLRMLMTWYRNPPGSWTLGTGEEDWFTSPDSITRLNAAITYCRETLTDPLLAIFFGWCWDMTDDQVYGDTDWVYGTRWGGRSIGGPDGDTVWGLDAADSTITGNHVSLQMYLDATWYYDTTNRNLGTRAVFSTGPADNFGAAENGYQRYLKHERIREYVREDSTRVFFDYADILNYNNAGVEYYNPTGWTDYNSVFHTYPTISPVNDGDYDGGIGTAHISDSGTIRIGEALWYIFARLSGWNGDTLVDSSYTVTIDQTGEGTVVLDPVDGVIDSGDTVFADWEAATCWNRGGVTSGTDTIIPTGDSLHPIIFYIDTFYVDTIYGANGTITTPCNDTIFACAEICTLYITPASGYRIVGNQDSLPDTLIWSVEKDSIVSVTFELWPTFTVDSTIVNGLPDSVVFSHFGTVDSGITITVTINSPVDTQCTVSGDTSGILSGFTDVIDGNKSYTFTFDAIPVGQVTLTVNNDGSTTPSGDTSVTENDPVNIVATSSTGYGFVNWSVESDTSGITVTFGDIADSTTTVAIDGNVTIQSNHDIDSFTVTLETGVNGTITSPCTDQIFGYGESDTVIFTPSNGYRVIGSTDKLPDTSIFVVIADTTIDTTFELFPTYTVSGTIVGNGSIIYIPEDSTADSGTSVTCIANADAGNTFSAWSGDTSNSNDTIIYTLHENKNITATFYFIPIVDSNRCIHQRAPLWNVGRVRDTMTMYGTFPSSGDSTAIFINSTGTVRGIIISHSSDSVRYQIPTGTPRAYYRSRYRSANEVLSVYPSSYNLRVKVPGGI